MMGGLTGKRTHLDAAESTTQTARQLPIKIKPGTSLEDSKAIAFGRDLPPLSFPTSKGAINPRNGPLTRPTPLCAFLYWTCSSFATLA